MNGIPMEVGQLRPATIACCNCGRAIDGTRGLTMCFDCVKLSCRIADDVPRESNVQFCRNCERYFMPPSTWAKVDPESRELLAILLKRLPGLNKVRLVDASFLWTEPHSRRLKLRITVQGEAQPGVILEENFVVEYVVIATQCADCAKTFTVHTWRAMVQLRQKVSHKKSFLLVEQLILKHKAHSECTVIRESRDGIDFYFSEPGHALKLVEFLSQVVPVKYQRSETLISTDTHTGNRQFKFTYAVDLVPICLDDLVVLPKQLAEKLSNISQVLLCTRISQSLQLLDPNTLQVVDLPSHLYWRDAFPSLATNADLTQFVVLENELQGPLRGTYALSDVVVARADNMNQLFSLKTHLGALLKPGDIVLGYNLVNSNYNNDFWDAMPEGDLPDVVLVKKFYQNLYKPHPRNFKLKRLAREYDDVDAEYAAHTERDYQAFLNDLEENKSLRENVNLYKARDLVAAPAAMAEDDDGPVIDVSELIDDLEDLDLNEN